MTEPEPEATTRAEAEDLIAAAFQIAYQGSRDGLPYTVEQLEEMLFCCLMASVKLKKLPGGQEAAERMEAKARAELTRRRRETFQAVEPCCATIVDNYSGEICGRSLPCKAHP